MYIEFVIKGRVACTAGLRLVILTSETLIAFEIYRGARFPTLQRTRTDSIWPARRITITEGDKSMTYSSLPNGYHTPGRAAIRGDGFTIAAGVLGRGDRRRDDSIRVFRFSLSDAAVRTVEPLTGIVFPLPSGADLIIRPAESPPARLVYSHPR